MKLFGLTKIALASDAQLLARNTIDKCKNLLSHTIKEPPSQNTIKNLDEISNRICCAIDPLSACSRLHPNIECQTAANNATKELQQFMNELNDDENIYNLLNKIKSDKELFDSLSEEEKQITNISLLEIKLSTAIHKTQPERDKINDLRYDISIKEDEFYRLCHDIQENELTVNDGNNEQKLIVNHKNFGMAMKTWNSSEKRREMFELFYSNHDIRLNILQQLREYRHDLAKQIGYNSFAELKSETSLFEGNTNSIHSYLINLSNTMEEKCKNEVNELIKYNNNNNIKLWDLTYIKRAQFVNEKENKDKNKQETDVFVETIENYLEIDNCLQSLQRLMNICFNIEMDKCLFTDEYILKYELKHLISDELIGILYFDLFERENKAISECITYPLYCSSKYNQQIPQVIISINISKNCNKLSHYQLMALYHEFGHALHYLLSDTQYQTLSGSRGLSMEYLEFPSSFFENFVFDKLFLKYIIMDNNIMHIPSQNVLNSIKNPFHTNLHSMQQITDSLLDLRLFGDDTKQQQSIKDIVYNTYKPLAMIMNGNDKQSDIDDALKAYLLRTSRFYHFIDYPANYYSYVIAEKISDKIWSNTFGNYTPMENNLDENNDRKNFEHWKNHMRYHGQRLHSHVFAFGSVKSPLQCLNNFSDSRIDLV